MNDKVTHETKFDALEAWKEACRELQHSVREITTLFNKVMAYFEGQEIVSVPAIEIDCRNYLAAANQRYSVMRRTIDKNKTNPHYSLKQAVEFEKKTADMINASQKAWQEMLTWIPKLPATEKNAH